MLIEHYATTSELYDWLDKYPDLPQRFRDAIIFVAEAWKEKNLAVEATKQKMNITGFKIKGLRKRVISVNYQTKEIELN